METCPEEPTSPSPTAAPTAAAALAQTATADRCCSSGRLFPKHLKTQQINLKIICVGRKMKVTLSSVPV